MKDKITCKCGTVLHIEGGYHGRIKDIIDRGWGVAPTMDGKVIPLCPPCYELVSYHAKEIARIAGSDHVSVSNVNARNLRRVGE